MMTKIKDLITISLQSVKKKINPEERKGCFEIFGYDFVIDEDFDPWIIEINTNPSLEETNPFLNTILNRMIGNLLRFNVLDDAFKLTLD
jgi:hypothetical protein